MKELTILMPCLNEEKTLAACIAEARAYLDNAGIKGEILIADNGSLDGSKRIALEMGARVIEVPQKGYGSALRGGIAAARGDAIIMGDCDGSYDFGHLDAFVQALEQGAMLVMGNRMHHIEKGAMPFSHRYLGVPVLSFLGRMRYHVAVQDFHCGLRGMNTKAAQSLPFQCTGMEFATEMIALFQQHGYKIVQVETCLRRDGRGHPSHLHSIRDGLRHLRYLCGGTPSKMWKAN